jgi:hypothetical protein
MKFPLAIFRIGTDGLKLLFKHASAPPMRGGKKLIGGAEDQGGLYSEQLETACYSINLLTPLFSCSESPE